MWFFYLLRKVLLIITDWLGFFRGAGYIISGPLYLLQQSYGAWLMLTIHTLWAAKHYLKEVGREIPRPTALSQQESLSYRKGKSTDLARLSVPFVVLIERRNEPLGRRDLLRCLLWMVNGDCEMPSRTWTTCPRDCRAKLSELHRPHDRDGKAEHSR